MWQGQQYPPGELPPSRPAGRDAASRKQPDSGGVVLLSKRPLDTNLPPNGAAGETSRRASRCYLLVVCDAVSGCYPWFVDVVCGCYCFFFLWTLRAAGVTAVVCGQW